MKKILAVILSCLMLITGCTSETSSDIFDTSAIADTISETSVSTEPDDLQTETAESSVDTEQYIQTASENESSVIGEIEDHNEENTDNEQSVTESAFDTNSEEYVRSPGFTSLNDEILLQYINDSVYSDLESTLASDDYHIEAIDSIYVSKEYINELNYNSQENIYFGYKLSELNEQFQGQKYIFTLGKNGNTEVISFEQYRDNIFNQVVKNVAIGTGIILVCVTVSTVTAGMGVPAINMIFAASAKTATEFALSSSVLGAISAGVVEGYKTNDFDMALRAATIAASESFKWGALIGAFAGGGAELYKIVKSGNTIKNAINTHSTIEIGRAGEAYAQEIYKGESQVSYFAGKEVNSTISGATRPDIVLKHTDGTVEAIEVKNYDLVNHLQYLKKELRRQVTSRVDNLPKGSTQKIALITNGRGYSPNFTQNVVKDLQEYLFDAYGGTIPIDIL